MMHKKKIMVVDDEPDILTYLAAIFEDNGFETITADSGVQAVALAGSEKPDLITLDITMPDQSGVRTYLDIKGDPDLAKIPIIVITAMVDSEESFLNALNGGPQPVQFLYKPINTKELLRLAKAQLAV
jgi:CheY-like chemotaxis protein